MKLKITIISAVLIQLFTANFISAQQSEWTKINENVKTTTFGNVKYFDKKLSYEEAVRVSMCFATYYSGYKFTVNQYSKKEFLKTDFFTDDYIYGTAVKALTKLNYGIVSIDYFESDDEYENQAGWNSLYLLKLKDDSILCLKLFKETETRKADYCELYKTHNQRLVLGTSSKEQEIHIFIGDSNLALGEHLLKDSSGTTKFRAVLTDIKTNSKIEAKTVLSAEYDGDNIKIKGKAIPYENGALVPGKAFNFIYDGKILFNYNF